LTEEADVPGAGFQQERQRTDLFLGMAFTAAALAKLATGCFLMAERTFLEGLVPPFPIHFVDYGS